MAKNSINWLAWRDDLRRTLWWLKQYKNVPAAVWRQTIERYQLRDVPELDAQMDQPAEAWVQFIEDMLAREEWVFNQAIDIGVALHPRCRTDPRNEAIHELVTHDGISNGPCKPDWARIAETLEQRGHGKHEPDALRISYGRWLKRK
jgi:hypothetical protein